MSNLPKDKQSETSEKADRSDRTPAAGPHAKPELTDYEKTPGTGSLPDKTTNEGDIGPD